MSVSCSPLRFEAEPAALRGRDGVGRGQFLIGSHIQGFCDVHFQRWWVQQGSNLRPAD